MSDEDNIKEEITIDHLIKIISDCSGRAIRAMDENHRGACRKNLKSIQRMVRRFENQEEYWD